MNSHGGGCCGMQHSSGYMLSLREAMRKLDGELGRLPAGRLMEVVLTDGQFIQTPGPEFGNYLASKGFKLVSRFVNGNSGNICNVFHYHENPLPVEHLPFPMDAKRAPAVRPLIWRLVQDGDFDGTGKRLRVNKPSSWLHLNIQQRVLGPKRTKFYYPHYSRVRIPWESIEVEVEG